MRTRMMVFLALLAGCMSAQRDTRAVGADAMGLGGAWIGLDDAGAHWWRLDLGAGRGGRGGFETDGVVARYRITDWSSDAKGSVTVHLARAEDATAIDAAPRAIHLQGKSDGVWLRLMRGKTEIVFLREDRLLAANQRLKKRLAAE